MTTKNNDLDQIMQTLHSLQAKVEDLNEEAEHSAPSKAVPDPSQGPVCAELPGACGDIGQDAMGVLRRGIADLSTMSQPRAFPEYFARLANRTGLRMLLLKRWTSGLQVFLEQNIKVPAEAKRKRPDGRAPIPVSKTDIFAAIAHEMTVYCGPVPVKHFPLDLTLMLGRGSRDRQIIILPLPSQGHWNTFLYLDADQSTGKSLAVAEVLAHFAVARMILMSQGVQVRHGRVSSILKSELYRRSKSRQVRTTRDVANPVASGLPVVSDLDLDPFASGSAKVVSGGTSVAERKPVPRREIRELKLAPSTAAVPPEPAPLPAENAERAVEADPVPVSPEVRLTPESILHHSGELPALPRAACHIMAVIDDPRTTATKLEAALAMDQALTAKVLRIANSPFYGAMREITTVSEAIVRLGFVTIRNWTLVTAARSVFVAPGSGALYEKIWHQSVMSAMAGQLVAQVVGKVDPEAVFIGGLMQNIGQLVLARSQPELFQEILMTCSDSGRLYHEVEQEMLGFDHGTLGAILIKEWNLSQDLEHAVRWHHHFADPEASNARVAAMIALGEEISLTASSEDQMANDANESPVSSGAAAFLGVGAQSLADLLAKAAQLRIDPHFFA